MSEVYILDTAEGMQWDVKIHGQWESQDDFETLSFGPRCPDCSEQTVEFPIESRGWVRVCSECSYTQQLTGD